MTCQSEVRRRGGWKQLSVADLIAPVPEAGCWLWLGAEDGKGYGSLYDKEEKATVRAHRYFFKRAGNALRKGQWLCHKCDTPLCVNPDHLYIGTPADNSRDMATRGRVKGERHSNATLDDNAVREIRRLGGLMHHGAIAKQFRINRSTVSKIIRGERWTHVK